MAKTSLETGGSYNPEIDGFIRVLSLPILYSENKTQPLFIPTDLTLFEHAFLEARDVDQSCLVQTGLWMGEQVMYLEFLCKGDSGLRKYLFVQYKDSAYKMYPHPSQVAMQAKGIVFLESPAQALEMAKKQFPKGTYLLGQAYERQHFAFNRSRAQALPGVGIIWRLYKVLS